MIIHIITSLKKNLFRLKFSHNQNETCRGEWKKANRDDVGKINKVVSQHSAENGKKPQNHNQ
jgi:hypothetical protein